MGSLKKSVVKMDEKKVSKKKSLKKQEIETEVVETIEEVTTTVAKKAPTNIRGKKYVAARNQLDRDKKYKLNEAIELLKKIKYSSFDETVEAHLVLKDVINSIDVSFPHSTGKTVRVQILDDNTLEELEKGVTNFDILLATPAQMGKITKYARLLGPKGLMPNPKNNTVTNDPIRRKKELESGKTTVKGEKKNPLMHVTIGKTSFLTKDLEENLESLLKALGNGKILKVTVCSSMSPGIKVLIS